MILVPILAVAGAWVGYNTWKKYKLAGGTFSVVPKHVYSITYQVTSAAGSAPVTTAPTVAQAQASLDITAPALWTVITTQASATAGSFVYGALYDGPGNAQVNATSLGALPSAGIIVTSVQDMGLAPVA